MGKKKGKSKSQGRQSASPAKNSQPREDVEESEAAVQQPEQPVEAEPPLPHQEEQPVATEHDTQANEPREKIQPEEVTIDETTTAVRVDEERTVVGAASSETGEVPPAQSDEPPTTEDGVSVADEPAREPVATEDEAQLASTEPTAEDQQPPAAEGETEPQDQEDEVASATQMLLKMEQERDEADAEIQRLDDVTNEKLMSLQQEKVNLEEKADIAAQHRLLIREQCSEMQAEIDALPTEEELEAMNAELVGHLSTRTDKYIETLRLQAEISGIEKQTLLEESLAASHVAAFSLQMEELHKFTRRKKYLFGSIEKCFDVPAALDTVAAITDSREVVHKLAADDLKTQIMDEEKLDETQIEQNAEDKQRLQQLVAHRDGISAQMAEAWAYEKQETERLRKKYTDICKETQYHLRRGSAHARPTKATPEEKRLAENQLSLQKEVKRSIEQFEALRQEIIELDTLANNLLQELEMQRTTNDEIKVQKKESLGDHKEFLIELRDENENWRQLLRDMEHLAATNRKIKITEAARIEQQANMPGKAVPVRSF